MNSSLTIPSHISQIAVGMLIACLPFLVWVEKHENFTWTNRLAIPTLTTESNRHTPRVSQGTFLPPVIDSTIELTSTDNPVILPSTTTITTKGKLTIKEGVNISVLEYGQLIVNGSLDIQGQPNKPVILTTNEVHEANQVWGGIIVMADSRATINHATIQHASPGIACQPQAVATITNTTITQSNETFLNKSSLCVKKE